jgi:hypothetical protein
MTPSKKIIYTQGVTLHFTRNLHYSYILSSRLSFLPAYMIDGLGVQHTFQMINAYILVQTPEAKQPRVEDQDVE